MARKKGGTLAQDCRNDAVRRAWRKKAGVRHRFADTGECRCSGTTNGRAKSDPAPLGRCPRAADHHFSDHRADRGRHRRAGLWTSCQGHVLSAPSAARMPTGLARHCAHETLTPVSRGRRCSRERPVQDPGPAPRIPLRKVRAPSGVFCVASSPAFRDAPIALAGDALHQNIIACIPEVDPPNPAKLHVFAYHPMHPEADGTSPRACAAQSTILAFRRGPTEPSGRPRVSQIIPNIPRRKHLAQFSEPW